MDSFVVVALALIGLAIVIAVCAGALAVLYEDRGRTALDPPSPYRAGLDAASRISSAAFEAERLMQVAAENSRRKEDQCDPSR